MHTMRMSLQTALCGRSESFQARLAQRTEQYGTRRHEAQYLKRAA
jgi:hypothetical protein